MFLIEFSSSFSPFSATFSLEISVHLSILFSVEMNFASLVFVRNRGINFTATSNIPCGHQITGSISCEDELFSLETFR